MHQALALQKDAGLGSLPSAGVCVCGLIEGGVKAGRRSRVFSREFLSGAGGRLEQGPTVQKGVNVGVTGPGWMDGHTQGVWTREGSQPPPGQEQTGSLMWEFVRSFLRHW